MMLHLLRYYTSKQPLLALRKCSLMFKVMVLNYLPCADKCCCRLVVSACYQQSLRVFSSQCYTCVLTVLQAAATLAAQQCSNTAATLKLSL